VHVKLTYSKGTIIIQGEVSTPYGQFDPRINAYRVQGYHYRDVLKYLENSKITYEDCVLDPPPAPPIEGEIQLYPYQQEALESWLKNEKRGVIVIATAGGKTFLGLKAITTTKEPTIIIVPTLVLVDHWVERLKEKLNIDSGVIGGGKKEIKYVTVTTYDSAYIYAEELGNKFSLMILDECLPYWSKIFTDAGQKNIGSIVNQRMRCKVLSYNFKRQGWEYREITNWIRKKPTVPLVQIKFKQRFSSLRCTVNHEVYKMPGGWTPAGEIKQNDLILASPKNNGGYKIPRALGKKQLQVIYGCSLGDANITSTGSMMRLRFVQSKKQLPYLKHKLEILNSLQFSKIRHHLTEFSPIDGVYVTASAATVDLPRDTNEIEIIKKLNWLGMAYWYLDDGSISRKTAVISTQGRTINLAKKMAATINLVFNLHCKAIQTQKGPEILFNVRDTASLSRKIRKYVIPEMQYKLLPNDRKKYEPIKPDPLPYAFVQVKSVKEITLRGKKPHELDVYCIDVEANQNFITNARALVHNCHHALAPSFALVLEMFASPHRMGLTSTLHRPDLRHLDTPRLMGDVVYEATHEQLAGKYVAPFEYEKIFVDLTSEEKVVYEQQRKIYTDYLEKANLQLRTYEDFRRLIMRSGFDPEARAAVLARNLAFKIALNSAAKINFLAEQLKQVKEKTLIFTLHNDTVYQISKRFLVPAITHQTPEKERREILQKFKSGEYMVIVTSQVLDEGVDIPSASLGIILSGTGSPREYIQRLGRVLRKQEGKVAHLIEVVSRATSETGMSLRRHRRLQDAAE